MKDYNVTLKIHHIPLDDLSTLIELCEGLGGIIKREEIRFETAADEELGLEETADEVVMLTHTASTRRRNRTRRSPMASNTLLERTSKVENFRNDATVGPSVLAVFRILSADNSHHVTRIELVNEAVARLGMNTDQASANISYLVTKGYLGPARAANQQQRVITQ